MTTTFDDPIVQQTIRRALTAAQQAGHTVAGLLDMAPRPLATGVCVRCGGRLTVSYDAGPRRTPLTDWSALTGRCNASGAWRAQADATESLRPLAIRARSDLRFLAYPLHLYARRHGLDSADLALRLGMPTSALDRLSLSAVPADALALPRLDRETGASSHRLGEVLAEAQALVDEDGRERRRQERAAEIEEARRERDSYLGLYQRAHQRRDALTATDATATVADGG